MVEDTPNNQENQKRSYHYTREKQLEIKANRKLREAKKKAQKAKFLEENFLYIRYKVFLIFLYYS